MPKNLNSFVLPDSVIDVMKQKLEKTEKIRRELGFNLCQIGDSKELKDDTHCIGSECAIVLEGTCKTGKKVGLFHTHPEKGKSDPSIADLDNAYYYGINCIGGVNDKKIKCYIRKDKTINTKDIKTIRYYREQFEPLKNPHKITTQKGYGIVSSKFAEMKYTRDKLRDNYFNSVDII